MRSIARAAGAALGLVLVSGVAQAQAGGVKIAYVNTEALMAAAPGRAEADSLLNKEGEGYRAQLQKLQDSVNTALANYQKKEPTMTAAQKDAAQKSINALEQDLQNKNSQFQQQFQQRTNEVMAPITEAVRKVLDDIRAEDGYAIIFANDPGGSAIVAADKNLDITDRVVARLRTTAAAKPAAAKPGAPAGVTSPKKPPTQ
ncbi:MAG TPA: OmpH family outer membrane protein [Gemmatimonadaceae bacterium]|nr:OmpH family outer membrane protein [Gemmatimonadaceae bacterium]